MFFRTKQSPSGQCLQLLESFRNPQGEPRHRVVVSLGDASIAEGDRPRIARLVEQRLRGQAELAVRTMMASHWIARKPNHKAQAGCPWMKIGHLNIKILLKNPLRLFLPSGLGRRRLQTPEAQVAAVPQLPLHPLPRRQIQRRRQGQRHIHKKPGRATLRADDLHFHHIFCLHDVRLLYRLASCQSGIYPLGTATYELAPLFHPGGTLLHRGALGQPLCAGGPLKVVGDQISAFCIWMGGRA